MAQNVTIAGASYSNVPSVNIPKTGGGTAKFVDTSDANAVASDILASKTAYVNGQKITGTGSGGGGGGNVAVVTFTSTAQGVGPYTLAIDSNFAAHYNDSSAVLTVILTNVSGVKGICHYVGTNFDMGATSAVNYGVKQHVTSTPSYGRSVVLVPINGSTGTQGSFIIDSSGNLKYTGSSTYSLAGTYKAILTW